MWFFFGLTVQHNQVTKSQDLKFMNLIYLNFLELRLNHWISQLPPHRRIKTIWYLLIKIHPESSKIIYCAKVKIHVKSHGVQINTDPRKTLIWNKTLPWELFKAMFEKTQTKNFYRKVFHHGQSTAKLFKANIWSCNNNHQVSRCPNQYWSHEDLDME